MPIHAAIFSGRLSMVLVVAEVRERQEYGVTDPNAIECVLQRYVISWRCVSAKRRRMASRAPSSLSTSVFSRL